MADFVLACAAPLLLAWAWDASRVASSWWVLGGQAYGTLGQRGGQWGAWVSIAAASLGWLLLIGGLAAWLEAREVRSPAWPLLLALLLLGWIPLHSLLGMQPWERYLLPLVPIVALLWTELFPLRALGLPPHPPGEAIRQPLRLQRPALEPLAPSSAPGVSAHVRYPSRRLYPLGALFAVFMGLIPALVTQYQLEPHDGRWEGIAEIGAAIERLPAEAIVFYLDSGRPLAWYAANARARLVWGGATERELRETLNPYGTVRRYLVLSQAALADLPAGWEVVMETSGFVLLVSVRPEARRD